MIERWGTERGDPHDVSLVRALLGGLLVYEAGRRFVELARDGFFADAFYMPLVPASLVPSKGGYVALLGVEIVAGALATVGVWARSALVVSGLLGLYLLACDGLQVHNNRYALLLLALLVSRAPCDARLALHPKRPPSPDGEPLWAQRLAQLQLCVFYLVSGGGKLFDTDWRAGLVLGDRMRRYGPAAVAAGAPQALIAFLGQPHVAGVASKIAIATELGLAFALWLPRTRALALWWGVMFHLTIQVTSKVDIFTWLMLIGYALFAVPATRERSALFPSGRRGLSRAIGALDWLHRFERREAPDVARVTLVDRDGRRATGLAAWALAARALPLLFPLWAPLAVAAAVFSRGERPMPANGTRREP